LWFRERAVLAQKNLKTNGRHRQKSDEMKPMKSAPKS
jgi:hypothetical protein